MSEKMYTIEIISNVYRYCLQPLTPSHYYEGVAAPRPAATPTVLATNLKLAEGYICHRIPSGP